MKLLRLYEDELGQSHFDVVERSMTLLDAAPPSKPVFFTQPEPATAWASVRCPRDWDGGLHPAPARQILICTGGSMRVISSLGDFRDLVPGAVILVEDTKDKGHTSEVTSSEPFEAMIIRLE
jgi:hypothetical protein